MEQPGQHLVLHCSPSQVVFLSLKNNPSMCRPSAYRQTVYGQCRPGEINTGVKLCVRFKYYSNSSLSVLYRIVPCDVSVLHLPEWGPHTASPAHWHRTRTRPSTGCLPEGFGPVPRKPATPSASAGCAPSVCAETPWTPEEIARTVLGVLR